MAKISDLSDELLVTILSFLPTKLAVSTSVLSKQWEFLWMWLPNLDFDCAKGSVRDFFNKNLPLHKSPIIKSLRLTFLDESLEAEASKSWVGIAVSRGLRELSIRDCFLLPYREPSVLSFLPSSLYTCNSLVTLELKNSMILVDVPRTVSLPSLKTLKLRKVTYSNDDSLRLLLSYCPVLEDLTIERSDYDNVKVLIIVMSSLLRLSLDIPDGPSDGIVIVTPSLKYFKVVDYSDGVNYLIENMQELEEADIEFWKDNVKLLESIRTVKRLSLCVYNNNDDEVYYSGGIDFNQLENLKLYISSPNWSKILFLLLNDSSYLQTLELKVVDYMEQGDDDEDSLVSWNSEESSVPKCLLKCLKTFKFEGSTEKKEERDFLSFIIKHACCLKSTSILR